MLNYYYYFYFFTDICTQLVMTGPSAGYYYRPPGVHGYEAHTNTALVSRREPIQTIVCFFLVTLHWLPTKHRIDELLSHYSPSRPLRSQNSGHLIIPRISKSTAGGRSFSYLAPKLWNNLPNTVREADTLCQFKSRLKTHLFNLAYT